MLINKLGNWFIVHIYNCRWRLVSRCYFFGSAIVLQFIIIFIRQYMADKI